MCWPRAREAFRSGIPAVKFRIGPGGSVAVAGVVFEFDGGAEDVFVGGSFMTNRRPVRTNCILQPTLELCVFDGPCRQQLLSAE